MAEVSGSTPEQVRRLARRLQSESVSLKQRSIHELIETLGAVGERFLDPGDPIRAEALDRLPESAQLSAPMARAVLQGMAIDWSRPRLRRLVEEEFGDPEVLDAFQDRAGRTTRAVGGDLTVQIVAGSVPGVGVNALLRSLLVKSPTLIKTGAGDTLLPELFELALRDADESLAESLAVRYWPGSSGLGQTDAAMSLAAVAVVYGSDRTVKAIRSLASPRTRVVAYRHREAVVLVGGDALATEAGSEDVAGELALAVSLFDQRGCVCPHLVLVEKGAAVSPEAFARLLAEALSQLETELPSGESAIRELSAVHQMRGVSELQVASSGGFVSSGGGSASWTVFFQPVAMEGPATSGRGVRVRPVADLLNLGESLSTMGPHLQSVGVAGAGSRLTEIADAVGLLGASRVVPIDRLAFPPAWWLHDGQGPLRELVRWVEVEAGEGPVTTRPLPAAPHARSPSGGRPAGSLPHER